MRTSCINHPPNEPLIVIRPWQVELCEGNTTAAALLSYFEYWHNIKLEMQSRASKSNDIAEMHGDKRTQDETLLQFHTEEELISGIMIAKRDTIRKALSYLNSCGFISIHANPNPKYAFDKTRYFLFHPDPINEWLNEKRSLSNFLQSKSKNRQGSSEKQPRQSKSQSPSSKNHSAITEITSEITPEITSEINPPLPPKGKNEGESIKVVEAEVTNKELATIPSFVASISQASTQEDNFSSRADRPTKKCDNTVTILDRYESGEVAHLPRHELIKIANQQIGEVVRAYRRSGRILASSPNDINRAFLAFIAKRDRKDTEYATRLINVCERTPDRWGELTEMVKSWKAKEVFNGYSAEHVAEVHSILQNIADL
jgi:hypothetical protein